MIITLDNAYQSELLLLPARNSAGELKGLEILVNFTGVDSDVRIPTELVIPRLSAAEELALFNEKLQLLDTCKLFFIQHQLIAWINITPAIVEFLLSNGNAVSILERYPFLEFTVNENYPGLNNGKDDLQLARMAIHFPLVLALHRSRRSTMDYLNGLFSIKASFSSVLQSSLLSHLCAPSSGKSRRTASL